MSVREKMGHIWAELKGHAPFTFAGALLGLGFMLLFRNVSKPTAHVMFGIFHPAHVALSAVVTAGLYKLHARKARFLMVLLIGYFGAVAVSTLSDSIIPHMGQRVFGVAVPLHSEAHHAPGEQCATAHTEAAADGCDHDHAHGSGLHLGFIEEWYAVTPAAILGILVAWFFPRTRFPHAAHVLISVWASSAYMLMNTEATFNLQIAIGYLLVLFGAVLLPCCISDIVFPLLFVRSDIDLKEACVCSTHALHSHPHKHEHSESCGIGGGEAV